MGWLVVNIRRSGWEAVMWFRRGPLRAWEKISTALYVHEWGRQVKECNPIFRMLTSEHPIGRHCWQAQFWSSHRGVLGVYLSEPRRPFGGATRASGPVSAFIIHGKLVCKSPDLNEGWGQRENSAWNLCRKFSWKWSVGRGRSWLKKK